MNWYAIASNDWDIYHDTTRLKNYVLKGKITEQQYTEISGETYVIA